MASLGPGRLTLVQERQGQELHLKNMYVYALQDIQRKQVLESSPHRYLKTVDGMIP